MFVSHSLQEHVSGFQDLINFLNLLKELLYLMLFGTSSQASHNEQFLCFFS